MGWEGGEQRGGGGGGGGGGTGQDIELDINFRRLGVEFRIVTYESIFFTKAVLTLCLAH